MTSVTRAHLFLVLVLVFILQAAARVDAVGECGTLRVVLGAPEAVFPQFVTFCTTDMFAWKCKKKCQK